MNITGNLRKRWLLVQRPRIVHGGANVFSVEQAYELVPITTELLQIELDAVQVEATLSSGLLHWRLNARDVGQVFLNPNMGW